jgi:protein-S-isoprenylcysteine O-methyltransferase Ste14
MTARDPERSGVDLLVRNVVFFVAAPGTLAGLAPWALTRGAEPSGGGVRLLAAILMAAGAGLMVWSVAGFARAGRGTPAPFDAPRHLVTGGPYRWCRNPMYVGAVVVLLGWLALVPTLALAAYTAGVIAGFAGFVRLFEEPRLRRRFGAEYEAYSERVGRLCPRRPRPRPGR